MGYKESVLQRRLLQQPLCSLLVGCRGDTGDPLEFGGHHHLWYNLSCTKVLWRLGAGTGAVHGMALLLEGLVWGSSPSVPPKWLCPSWQLLLLSPDSSPWLSIILFEHPTSLHLWSGSTCSATGLSWLCSRRLPGNYRITGWFGLEGTLKTNWVFVVLFYKALQSFRITESENILS